MGSTEEKLEQTKAVYAGGKNDYGNLQKHGVQAGETVSKILHAEFINGNDLSKKIRDFSFIMEDYECMFYGLQMEVEQLPETCVGGDFTFQSEPQLNEVLGRITVMCLACLKEAMNGEPLPVKDGGP